MSDETTCPDGCAVCTRRTRNRVCPGCQNRLDERLADLPALYQALGDHLEPGTTDTAYVTGSRTPPTPTNLTALDLRGPGGITTLLGDWEADWRATLGWSPPPFRGSLEQALPGVVGFLRNNLLWAVDQHPAIEDFAAEISRLHASASVLTTREERRPPLGYCPATADDGAVCGQPVRWPRPADDAVQCPAGHQWPRSQWLQLAEQLGGVA